MKSKTTLARIAAILSMRTILFATLLLLTPRLVFATTSAAADLTCMAVAQIDAPQFRFLLDNPKFLRDLSHPGTVTARPNQLTIPAGATITIVANLPKVHPELATVPATITLTFKLDHSVTPGTGTDYVSGDRRYSGACSATATW